MNSIQKNNFRRLLEPKTIAFVGGDSAIFAANQCKSGGFSGEVWGVNPKAKRFGHIESFQSIENLPEAPDAAFIAIPRESVPDAVLRLRDKGTGGIVCYSAGFGELGLKGQQLEKELIKATGDMALAGPNVFGLLNYITGAHLWPYSHGGKLIKNGPAIISQSGMLSSYVVTNKRSINFSYVIGAGNHSVLGVEDYLDYLVDSPEVTGFGLYIETLRDIPLFANAVSRAMKRDVPVVALKVGKSEIASRTALTHTGSLAGEDTCYQAMFDRIGVPRVSSPSLLLETLQMLTVAGAPAGPRIAAFTCSGGDVAMLADCAEDNNLVFDEPDENTKNNLKTLLPEIATVSNPLDYTTPLWGQEEKLKEVFLSALSPGYDSALLVQDYPPEGLGSDRPIYEADARAFIHAVKKLNIPAAICSSLPENLDQTIQRNLIANGVAPLQGLSDATSAIKASITFGSAKKKIKSGASLFIPQPTLLEHKHSLLLDEWRGKIFLKSYQIQTPKGHLTDSENLTKSAIDIGFPVALKLVNENIPHKSDVGIVKLNIRNKSQLQEEAKNIIEMGSLALGEKVNDIFIVEEYIDNTILELMVGVQNHPQFGMLMTIAIGGIFVELLNESITLLLPISRPDLLDTIKPMTFAKLLSGYRGLPEKMIGNLLDTLMKISNMVQINANKIIELDINPILITQDSCIAADALVRLNSEK